MYPVRRRNGVAHFGLSLARTPYLDPYIQRTRLLRGNIFLRDNISSEFIFSSLIRILLTRRVKLQARGFSRAFTIRAREEDER